MKLFETTNKINVQVVLKINDLVTVCANEEKVGKLLGVSWNCLSDELFFNLFDLIDIVNELSVRKRSLLPVTAKIFDPLGIPSPFVIKLKVLFQVKDWDESLQGKMLNKWNTIVNELNSLDDYI